jgi:pimeloyl-ACP methyl ester carboxylesterase
MTRMLPILFCLVSLNMRAQIQKDTVLTMSDAVKIDALYIVPASPPPPEGYPAIVFVHGFSGSKEDVRSWALSYAQRGYVTSGYSVRGQGNSGGEFDFFTSERVLADLKAVIDFTKSLPGVRANRVAVAGGSQGGIHAWAAAAAHLGVRTIVSMIANGRFEENWVENNAMNWTFARAISVAPVRFKPGLKDSINAAIQTGNLTFVRQMLTGYSTTTLESAVDIPVAIMCSYFDGFFNQSAALRQFARIPTPKRIVLYPGGHATPSVPAQRAYTENLQNRWFEYWLKDADEYASVASPDSAVMMFDATANLPHMYALKDSALWLRPTTPLPSSLVSTTYYFTPSGLTETPPGVTAQSTISYVNGLGSTPIAFRTQPFPSDAVIAGASGNAELSTDGTGSQYQMVISLFDVDAKTGAALPISRGFYQVPANIVGTRDALSFQLTSVAATIKAGHLIEARVHGGIGLIPNTQNEFGNYVLGPVPGSVNTLFMGGTTPSRFTLHFLTGTTSTVAQAIAGGDGLLLDPNYPQPFGGSGGTGNTTLLRISTRAAAMTLRVYDNLGRLVSTLFDGDADREGTLVTFDATGLPSGVYFAVLSDSEGGLASRRMVVAR